MKAVLQRIGSPCCRSNDSGYCRPIYLDSRPDESVATYCACIRPSSAEQQSGAGDSKEMSTHPACVRGARSDQSREFVFFDPRGIIASSQFQQKTFSRNSLVSRKRFSVSNFAPMIRCQPMVLRPRSLTAIETGVLGNSATRHENMEGKKNEPSEEDTRHG
jgi:hypothetical protein